MDARKLSFEVDASQIDIKPLLKKEFLELTMRAISTANPNRNNSWFTRESLVASLDTFKNKPILGYFENGDFVSHNGQWKEDPETELDYWDTISGKGERPLGLIRGDDEVKIIDDEKTGLSWVVLTCALWTQYNYKQVKRLLQDAKRAKKQGGPTKNISVEVDITDYEILPNNVMKINAFNLVGITILGSRNGVKVEPGIADAELSVVDIMGTELYEKQMKSLRLAYEKLDGSENKNKEDFSEMELEEKVNSELEDTPNPAPAAADEPAPAPATEEGTPNPEADSQHFENQNENGSEQEEDKEPVHENHEEGHDEEDDDEDEGVCPDCGKNPCECEKHENEGCGEEEHQNNEENSEEGKDEEGKGEEPKPESESVHENEEISQDVVRDVNWLIGQCSWNIDDFKCAIGYYEANETIQGRDYILPVLRRLLAQAIANEKELAELMGKIAQEVSPEEIQMQEELCDHCDCKTEYAAYTELLKENNSLKEEKAELEGKFEAIEKAKEHAQFVEEAKAVIAGAKLTEEIAQSFEKACDDGSINTLDELKTQIGLKLYEMSAASSSNSSLSFDAPVSKPNVDAFVAGETETKKKTKWEKLRELNNK